MIGIDVGSRSLKLVQWDGKTLRRCCEELLPDNLFKNGRISSYDSLGVFLKSVIKDNKFSGRDCAVIIPAPYLMVRRLTLPVMTAQQLEMNLPYEFRDFLSDDKAEYLFDYALNAMVDDENGGKTMDIAAIAVRKEVIENYRSVCRAAGLRMRIAVPVESTYTNFIRAYGEQEREYCILDLGNTVTRIHFFKGFVHDATRIIEYGASHISALSKAAVGAHGGEIVRSDMSSMYMNIATEIRRAINFYSFNNRGSDITELWCCGGTAKYPELLSSITQATQLDIRSISEMLPAEFDRREDIDTFIQAFGAAIQ